MQHVKVTETNFMGDADAGSTAKRGGQAIHPILVPFPIACFTGALVTDLAYWQTADVLWETFSDWLITAGMITAGFAILAFVIDVLGRKPIRPLAWPTAVVYLLAV